MWRNLMSLAWPLSIFPTVFFLLGALTAHFIGLRESLLRDLAFLSDIVFFSDLSFSLSASLIGCAVLARFLYFLLSTGVMTEIYTTIAFVSNIRPLRNFHEKWGRSRRQSRVIRRIMRRNRLKTEATSAVVSFYFIYLGGQFNWEVAALISFLLLAAASIFAFPISEIAGIKRGLSIDEVLRRSGSISLLPLYISAFVILVFAISYLLGIMRGEYLRHRDLISIGLSSGESMCGYLLAKNSDGIFFRYYDGMPEGVYYFPYEHFEFLASTFGSARCK